MGRGQREEGRRVRKESCRDGGEWVGSQFFTAFQQIVRNVAEARCFTCAHYRGGKFVCKFNSVLIGIRGKLITNGFRVRANSSRSPTMNVQINFLRDIYCINI